MYFKRTHHSVVAQNASPLRLGGPWHMLSPPASLSGNARN